MVYFGRNMILSSYYIFSSVRDRNHRAMSNESELVIDSVQVIIVLNRGLPVVIY